MRIGIDGHPLHGKRTGVGRYVTELCRELDALLPDALFFVYSRTPVDMPVLSGRWILRTDPWQFSSFIKAKLWLKLRGGHLCRKDRLDLFWGTAGFLPNLPLSVKKVITVHDLNFKVVPGTMSNLNRWAFNLFFNKDVNAADVVLTVSRGTSDRLYNYYGKRAYAIVSPGAGKQFSRQPDDKINSCLSKYDIAPPYILSVATREPRKNLGLLLTTFLSMKKKGELNNYKLVLTGAKGWKHKKIDSLIKTMDPGCVMNLGYVPDEDLPFLYAGADMFIFPSLYEGFGIPILEARACGTRIVASDMPETREAGGKNSIYISPTAEGIRSGIISAIAAGRSSSAYEGCQTWNEGAKILIDAFKCGTMR